MRGKSIAEAFPRLRLEGAMKEYLAPARVERVAIDRKARRLYVQIVSRRWIHKKYIYGLEEEIGRQLFPDMDLQVHVREQFYLSGQYTPERFFEDYHSSLLRECREHDRLLCHVLQTAKITFPEADRLELSLEDTLTGHEKENELVLYLTRIFEERCHMPVHISVSWHTAEADRHKEEQEAGFRLEAKRIFAHSGRGDANAELPAGSAASETPQRQEKNSAPEQQNGRKGRRMQPD